MTFKKTIIGGLGAAAIGGVLMFGGTEQLTWSVSYETLLFDTPSGDMEVGYYADADSPDEYYMRLDETYQKNFDSVDKSTVNVKKLKEAHVIGKAYYDEFLKRDGTIVRERSTEKKYWDVARVKDYPQPTKTIVAPLLFGTKAEAAIAFDVSTNAAASSVSSISFSHTTTGSNLGLVVVVPIKDSVDAERGVSTMTYNSVSMAEGHRQNDNTLDMTVELWYLANPSSGANTVAVTFDGTITVSQIDANSYTGVHQTTMLDGNNGAVQTNATSVSYTLTTVADNSWIVDGASQDSGFNITCTPNSGQTELRDASGQCAGYEGPQTPAGGKTVSWACGGVNCTTDRDWVAGGISIAPAAAAAATHEGQLEIKSGTGAVKGATVQIK